jgi:phage shock protein PspC (stress-responsive transcriptional regulator)
MEKRQSWNLGGMEMIELFVLIFMLTGVFVWGVILYVIIQFWMEP